MRWGCFSNTSAALFSPNIYNDGDDKDDDENYEEEDDVDDVDDDDDDDEEEEDISNTSVALLFSKHLHLRSNIRLNTRHLFGETMMSECWSPSSSSQHRFQIKIISGYLKKKFRTNWLEWQLEAYWQYSLGTSEKEKGKCKQLIVCETICDTKSLDTKKYVEKYFEKYSR